MLFYHSTILQLLQIIFNCG